MCMESNSRDTWLGIVWKGNLGEISIAPHRIISLLQDLTQLLTQSYGSACQLGRVVGKVISTGPVTQNIGRIMARHLRITVASAPEWDTPLPIGKYRDLEINF